MLSVQRIFNFCFVKNCTAAALSRPLYTSSTIQNGSKEKLILNEADNKQVDFGFETVTASEKAEKVHKVFEAVASSYDLMNDLMSAGVHRIWKDHFANCVFPISPGTKILDVAGGTGREDCSIVYII